MAASEQSSSQPAGFLTIARATFTESLALAVKDSSVNPVLFFGSQCLRLLQMLAFPLASAVAAGHPEGSSLDVVLNLSQALSILDMPSSIQVTTFALALAWALTFVVLAVRIGIKSTFKLQQYRFELYLWRTMVFLSASFVFLPTLGSLVGFIACRGDSRDTTAELFGSPCWTGTHLGLALLSIFVAAGFVLLALAAAFVYADRSPGTDAVHATVDGRANAVMLMQQTFLILLYGSLGAENIPGWLAFVVLSVVAASWMWHFAVQQPHAVQNVNSLRAALGAVFAWGVFCLFLSLVLPPQNLEVTFYCGSVLSAVVAHGAVAARRTSLLYKACAELKGDTDLSLWARVRLQLAYQLHSNSIDTRQGLWLAGGTLLAAGGADASGFGNGRGGGDAAPSTSMGALASFIQRSGGGSSTVGNKAAAHNSGDGPDSVRLPAQGASLLSPSTLLARTPSGGGGGGSWATGQTPRQGAGVDFASPAHGGGGSPSRVPYQVTRTTSFGSPRVGGTGGTTLGAAERARRMIAGGAKSVAASSANDDLGSEYTVGGGSPRSVLASALIHTVHVELTARNDDAKLSAYLLILLADIRKQFLSNRFMELMALSQTQKQMNVPWDVQFWVTQRLQVLRSAQEHNAGSGGLSPVERLLFDQYYQWAIQHQKAWYLGMVEMWQELKSASPNKQQLQAVAQRMALALADTEHSFTQLMDINKNSVKVLKAYGHYLLRIRRSEAEGQALLARAERLEATALERSQREVSHFKLMEKSRDAVVMDESAAVIVVNGELSRLGEITAVNAVAASLFKRPKSALIGQNVNILLPSPISEVHDMFLRTYAASGRGTLMNTTRSLAAVDTNGVLFPVRATLRESPPLEGSSAPQFTMLMQPLRVTAQSHILFLDSARGYEITAADASSLRLMGLRAVDLHDSPTSVVQFFPEIDPAFSAAWQAQQQVMGSYGQEAQRGDSEHSSMGHHTGITLASVTPGPSVITEQPQQRAAAPALLNATKAFVGTTVANSPWLVGQRVLAMVQRIPLPRVGVMYMLSWKPAAKKRSKSAPRGRSGSSSRRRSAAAPSPARPRQSGDASRKFQDAARLVAKRGQPASPLRSDGEIRSTQYREEGAGWQSDGPAASGSDLTAKGPPTATTAISTRSAGHGAPEASSTHQASNFAVRLSPTAIQAAGTSPAQDSLPKLPPLGTAAAIPDTDTTGPDEHASGPTPSSDSPQSGGGGSTHDFASGTAEPAEPLSPPLHVPRHRAAGDSKATPQPNAYALPDSELPATDKGRSRSTGSTSFSARRRRTSNPNVTYRPPALSARSGMSLGGQSFGGGPGSVGGMSFGDRGGGSVGGSYASGGSRHSSVTKHVLASSISTSNQHPAVKHLQMTFVVQVLCLVAFAVVLFVLRRDSVHVLALFVDGLRNAEGRLLHAQAAVALVSAIIMSNEGISVCPTGELQAAFGVELQLLQSKVAALQDEQAELSIALGSDVASKKLVPVPDGSGGFAQMRVHDAVSWMQAHLGAINRLQASRISLATPEVAQLFNASDALLGEALPGAVKQFELRLIAWLDDQETEDVIVVVCGLAVVVLLVGGVATMHIQRLASHRHLVLDAIASVASGDAKKLARRALLDAKEHLTLLVDADQADGDAARELDGIESDDEAQGMGDIGGGWDGQSMRGSMRSGFARGGSVRTSMRGGGSMRGGAAFDAVIKQREQEAAEGSKAAARSGTSRVTDPAEAYVTRVDDSEVNSGVLAEAAMPTGLAAPRTGPRRTRAALRTKKIKDSSTFKSTALFKLMAPTFIVFAFIAGLWADWAITTDSLLVVVERTFAAEAFAVHATKSLGQVYTAFNNMPFTGRAPGTSQAVQSAVNSAVFELSELLTGSESGFLTQEQVPALNADDTAFELLVSNGCDARSEKYDLSRCTQFDGGVFTDAGLRGGLLRFTQVAVDLAGQLDSGNVAGANATALQAAVAARDRVAFGHALAPHGSAAANATEELHSLLFPYMLGIADFIAKDFHDTGRTRHGAALARSQAITSVLVVLVLVSMLVWIRPAALKLGRSVYATHSLVAAVPPDVTARVAPLRQVLRNIASLATAQSKSTNLSDLSALMGMADELEVDEVGAKTADADAGKEPDSKKGPTAEATK